MSHGDKCWRENQACNAECLGGYTHQGGPGRLLSGEAIGLCKEPASGDLEEGTPGRGDSRCRTLRQDTMFKDGKKGLKGEEEGGVLLLPYLT